MDFIKKSELSKSEKSEILALWNNEYPKKLKHKALEDFEGYLEKLQEQSHILVMDGHQRIKGWYFDFKRTDEKWFAIILDSKCQGQGLGKRILDIAKEKETKLNGWVIDHDEDKKQNGEIYRSPLEFYLKNGFQKLSQDRLELNSLSAVKIEWLK